MGPIEAIGQALIKRAADHSLRVAIDGIDAAGKSTLSKRLGRYLKQQGRAVIRASADDFLHPREIRYRCGPLSAEGYFRDSVNYTALKELLLLPLGPGGERVYRRASLDYRLDAPVDAAPRIAPAEAVLIVDGIFLMAPPLRELWDFAIFMHVRPETSLARALVRDADPSTHERYSQRYIPGQKYYTKECDPAGAADLVYGNDDPENPELIWR